jgi:hypothetical protein
MEPENDERRIDELNALIELVTTVIDDGLRAKGKRGLFDLDDEGVTLLESLVSPMRDLYEEWIQSRHVVLDFAADPTVSPRDQAAARLWMAGLLRVSDPERADQIQQRIQLWLYTKYAVRVVRTLWSYAQDEGLSGEDLCLANRADQAPPAGALARLMCLALRFADSREPLDADSRSVIDLRTTLAGLPAEQQELIRSTLPELIRGIHFDLADADQMTIAQRLATTLDEAGTTDT